MASVELLGVSKSYAGQKAVDGIDLHIADGSLACLLGPSGCGKTTTLRLIAGFLTPDEGEIRVGREVVSSPQGSVPPEGRKMSMVFQSYALWPHMTVAGNIAYGLKLRRLPREEVRRRVDAILAVTRLTPLAERYPGELSGGQQQRAALARALVVDPQTLLLDEPLSNLDANLREEMRFEVRRLHDEYRYTTVYVTHDQSEAMTTADLIAVMNLGKIEQAGSPEEIYDRPRSEFVARFIGSSNIVKGRALDANRLEVAGVPLACVGDAMTAGATRSISIRQHEVALSAAKPAASENVIPATVTRHVFLGNSRDYLLALDDGSQLRVVTSPKESIAEGNKVWLTLPPQRCLVLVS